MAEIGRLQLFQSHIEITEELRRKLQQEYREGLNKQLLGLLLSSAAAEDVKADEFSRFAHDRVSSLIAEYSKSEAFVDRYAKRRAEVAAQFMV